MKSNKDNVIEQLILEQTGYKSINEFKEDAEVLMESLKLELGDKAWNKYFRNE